MKIKIYLAIAAAVALVAPAHGQSCASFPYNPTNGFSNGNTADAGLLWSDFNSISGCFVNPVFTGNVGIGTTTAAYPLSVAYTSGTEAQIGNAYVMSKRRGAGMEAVALHRWVSGRRAGGMRGRNLLYAEPTRTWRPDPFNTVSLCAINSIP
jgi:hypothetical protein